MKTDVAIVGAGLAGLSCARYLAKKGRSVQIYEAADTPGGRVKSKQVNGFVLNRGFQALLTAYPEARRQLDYKALDLQPLGSGALVFYDGQLHPVADPAQQPLSGLKGMFSPLGSMKDKLKAARFYRQIASESLEELQARPAIPTFEALQTRWGFSDTIINRFFRPFIGGLTYDPKLQVSSCLSEFIFRMLATGTAAVPSKGMQAIPEQLANVLPKGTIHYNHQVQLVEPGKLILENGQTRTADTVVVATDVTAAARLLGYDQAPNTRSATTLYFAAADSPTEQPVMVLDGENQGPVNHAIALSQAAPSYAPSGSVLISAALAGIPQLTNGELEKKARRQLIRWFGYDVNQWRLIDIHRVANALPHQLPAAFTTESPKHKEGLFVCGDYRHSASINGALLSGRRCAEAIVDE